MIVNRNCRWNKINIRRTNRSSFYFDGLNRIELLRALRVPKSNCYLEISLLSHLRPLQLVEFSKQIKTLESRDATFLTLQFHGIFFATVQWTFPFSSFSNTKTQCYTRNKVKVLKKSPKQKPSSNEHKTLPTIATLNFQTGAPCALHSIPEAAASTAVRWKTYLMHSRRTFRESEPQQRNEFLQAFPIRNLSILSCGHISSSTATCVVFCCATYIGEYLQV